MTSRFINLVDFYKTGHRQQYPEGTEFVYSNYTPRSSRIAGQKHVVMFGLQYFLSRYLVEIAKETFFDVPKEIVLDDYKRMLDTALGPNDIGVRHIADLHDLGYMPLEFRALPEGTRVPLRVPMFTIENTHPEFFWVTNYIETMLSAQMWLPITSATTASRYRELLDRHCHDTGGHSNFVDWQGHDFSFRGMACVEAAALSGAGHLLSFTGTDTIPAIELLQDYYTLLGAKTFIGGSVPATEHSVMCAGGCEGELQTFERLLDLYPTGVVSVVSDTWDLWNVLTNILPKLKDRVMARQGKLVIRPDSGDPVNILCGDPAAKLGSPERMGVVELLWSVFGGTSTSTGHGLLDSHIGTIYGDSITYERADQICTRLAEKGFASTNVVFGIGSFTYQYATRDNYGQAIKATWAQINGKEHFLAKDPVTDDGVKKSATGRLAVVYDENKELRLLDGLSTEKQSQLGDVNLLKPVWRNGQSLRYESIDRIRQRLHPKK